MGRDHNTFWWWGRGTAPDVSTTIAVNLSRSCLLTLFTHVQPAGQVTARTECGPQQLSAEAASDDHPAGAVGSDAAHRTAVEIRTEVHGSRTRDAMTLARTSPLLPHLGEHDIAELKARLAAARLPPDHVEGWERGVPTSWLTELLADWRSHDFTGFQDRLDGATHLTADVDGHVVHLVHAPGRGPDPLPLLLTHGWPGSFLEYRALVPLLTDPERHGGDRCDAFTVVVPSLPGFGFSAPPRSGGLTTAQVAELWHRLMVEGLGYERYVAHGSDLGAGVTAWLARSHPEAVAGIHLATPGLSPPPQPWTRDVAAHVAETEVWTAEEGGYAHQHATKPATLAAGLLDSPAGLAAWIGEKVTAWSSTAADGQPAFPRQLLLDTLTLYWVTGTIGTSLLPYWAYRHTPGASLPADDQPPVPTSVSVFGGERVPFPKPPRQLAERYFTLTRWSEHDRGGHFPAVAEPELLTGILREAFRPLRDQ